MFFGSKTELPGRRIIDFRTYGSSEILPRHTLPRPRCVAIVPLPDIHLRGRRTRPPCDQLRMSIHDLIGSEHHLDPPWATPVRQTSYRPPQCTVGNRGRRFNPWLTGTTVSFPLAGYTRLEMLETPTLATHYRSSMPHRPVGLRLRHWSSSSVGAKEFIQIEDS